MKINKLYLLNLLNEMAGAMLNHNVDEEFYDYYMNKYDLNWLIENREKIVNDTVENYDSLKFELENNCFNCLNLYKKEDLKETIENMMNEYAN